LAHPVYVKLTTYTANCQIYRNTNPLIIELLDIVMATSLAQPIHLLSSSSMRHGRPFHYSQFSSVDSQRSRMPGWDHGDSRRSRDM